MITVNLATAKAKLSNLVARAEGGEEVAITRHGRTVARIVAPRRTPSPLRPLSAFRRTIPRWRKPSRLLLRGARDEER